MRAPLPGHAHPGRDGEVLTMDLVFIGMAVVFFALSYGFMRLAERLQ